MSTQTATAVAPSAFGDDIRRFVNLTVTLAKTEFKVRYFGSVLGYLWSLVRPLLLFAVLYLVFTQIFHVANKVPHYPAYLLTSIMLWTFFIEATTGSVQCLLTREGLLRKMRFPRLVIPLSVVLTALFNLSMNSIVIVGFVIGIGVAPRLSWLQMPFLVALLAILAAGTAMLLSALYVRFRDIQPIWDVTAQLLFYASPIIYTAVQYGRFVRVAMINPIAAILTQMLHAFIDPNEHGAARAIGGGARILIPLGIIAATFALGLWVFNREAPLIAENL
jgi:ABC-2 type transport system permease protein